MDRKGNQFVKRFCQHLPHLKKDEKKTVMLSSKFHHTSKTSKKHSILAVNGKHQPGPIFCHHHKPKQTTTTPWPVRLAYHSNPNISALDESALRVAWHRIQLQKHLEHLEAKNWCFGSMFLLSQRLAFFMWTSGVFWVCYTSPKSDRLLHDSPEATKMISDEADKK